MTTHRTLARWIPVAAITTALIATAIGLGTTAHAEGDDAPPPCAATSFKVAKVEAACKSGGQKAAKTLMKATVKKAKAAGETMNCKTCHKSLKTFELTDNAVTDLEKWI